jgi:NAD-dependent SIR2 family protein deacetylase
MSDKFILAHDLARSRAVEAVRNAPPGYVVMIKEPTRTLEQSALMWSLLTEISNQVIWYGNKLTKEEWKDVLSASLKKQKTIPGIGGGFVVTGSRTSKMTKKEMAELIELAYAFGVEQGVKFGEEIKSQAA